MIFCWNFIVLLLGFLLLLVKSSQFLLILFCRIWNSTSVSKIFWVLFLFWVFLLSFLIIIRILFFFSFFNNFCIFVLNDWGQIRSSINSLTDLRIWRKYLRTWLSFVVQKSSAWSFCFYNLITFCLVLLITQRKHFLVIWLTNLLIIL